MKNKPQKIKMIALDLDGTTLNNKGEFSPATRRAFASALKAGVHIVISTGRSFASLPKEIFEMEGLEYVITSNGAHITRLDTCKTIYENHVNSEAINAVVNALKGSGFSVEAFVDGRAYIDRQEFDQVQNHGSTYRDVNYILKTRNPVDDIFCHILENREKIENININFEFLEDKERMGEILRKIKNITLTSSFNHNWEIGGENTSKAQALRFLMNKLYIKEEELLACGDSPNDSKMIELAGVGACVANATDDAKAIADVITDSNENDGVAKIIEKYL